MREVTVSSIYLGALCYYVLLNSNLFGYPVIDYTVGDGSSKKFLSVKGNEILVKPEPFSMTFELPAVSSLGLTLDPWGLTYPFWFWYVPYVTKSLPSCVSMS